MTEPYLVAQDAMAKLKSAVWLLLRDAPEGLTNAAIGRSLGIYSGHIGHEGHISRTILGLMAAEGVVEQVAASKAWRLRKNASD